MQKRVSPSENRHQFRSLVSCSTVAKDNQNDAKTLKGLPDRLASFLTKGFGSMFKTRNADHFPKAHSYLEGVLASQWSNLEKLSETGVVEDYHQLQHFISDSPWDHQALLDQVSQRASTQFCPNRSVGLLIDESGNCKKGIHSVGVSRQYCGNVGKVANCQVGVYGSLSQGDFSCLVDARLYLPRSWSEDAARCQQAKIPLEARPFKRKATLALEIIEHQLDLGTHFDYVAMDAFYGADQTLTDQLVQRGICFIGDVRSNQYIYLQEPKLSLPPYRGRGRKPTQLKADQPKISLTQYAQELKSKDFQTLSVRNTAKGKLKAKFHFREVYIWDGEKEKASKRTLIIRKLTHQNKKIEFAFSLASADILKLGKKEVAKRQAQRFFIEHAFKEAKSVLGLDQFQTRKWIAWYHQIALICILLLFCMIEKMTNRRLIPLLSAQDIKQICQFLFVRKLTWEDLIIFVLNRHRKRQADINRFYHEDS